MNTLPRWSLATDAWRLHRRFTNRYVTSMWRLRTASILPAQFRARFLAAGIPAELVGTTLRSVRSVDAWGPTWIETAQALLNDYRRFVGGENSEGAERLRRTAAMCFHVAQLGILDDPRTATSCQSWAASLFAQSQPLLFPFAHRILLPWRNRELPAWYITNERNNVPRSLVIMLNDATTTKEELFGWSREFLRRSVSMLIIDTPGTGETARNMRYSASHDDVLDGALEFAAMDPSIDERRVSVMGIGMGANQALRVTARDRRILSCIAVTPSLEPSTWVHRVSPLLRHEVLVRGDLDQEVDITAAADFDAGEVADRIRKPVLIYGAAKDIIVPPGESQKVAAALQRRATLIWHEDGGHGLYDRISEITSQMAEWVLAIGNNRIEQRIDDPETLSSKSAVALT